MPLPDIHRHTIQNKSIYHFEDHASAILPWAELSKIQNHPPLLITLDHHTDTNSAWLRSLFRHVGRNLPLMEDLRQERIAKINPLNEDELSLALEDLHHDEHIDLALRLGILGDVVVIQHSSPQPLPEWAERGMTVLPFNSKFIEDSSSTCHFYNQALEDEWLEPLINHLPENLNPWHRPFILDIDLDYLKTNKSLTPDHSTTFQRLAQESIGITVAEEREWVDRLWLDEKPMPGALYSKLLELIAD
jgi:hypothetical protein